MMFKQETKETIREAETIIGPSVMVKGNFNSSGNIVIEGVLKGGVKTAGHVYIGDKANIVADIEAKSARVGGEVRGNLKIEDYLQVVSSAKIFGDVDCLSLSVESGAIINGKIVMSKDLPADKKEVKEQAEIDLEK
ncbi:MAG TPA: polymer-forming cytoskeletal protein [Candidatus Methylomirabilis sp.]|nr:polymer-forming cytoskeletal protein [Candidatus Methylomirabilis sp.]